VIIFSRLLDLLRARPEPDEERAEREAKQSDLIDRLARAVVARRLEAPAVLFLELNRPLGFIFSQATCFARPFLAFFLPTADVEAAAQVLDNPSALDALLTRIGDLSVEAAG
jgi:hypothetical protein